MISMLVLALAAFYAALQAFVCLANPAAAASWLGYTLTTPLAQSEFMTAYGGLYAGIGVFFALGLSRVALREGALALLALAGSGAALDPRGSTARPRRGGDRVDGRGRARGSRLARLACRDAAGRRGDRLNTDAPSRRSRRVLGAEQLQSRRHRQR